MTLGTLTPEEIRRSDAAYYRDLIRWLLGLPCEAEQLEAGQ